jgi:pyrophosphatase PpaX
VCQLLYDRPHQFDLEDEATSIQPRWTAALFDFDGTLGDSIDLILSSLRATAAELPGYIFDEAAVMPWIGRPLTAMLLEQGVSDHAAWLAVYRRHYLRAHDEMLRPIEGISELLERLANAGARIGVVSSKKTDYVELGLNRLSLGSWIDVIVGADDTQRHKPDPEPLLHTARLLDVVPSRCVYVGDAVTDVVAGRAADMATIAVTWGAATADDLAGAGPTAVVSSVTELAAQLLTDAR